MTVVDVAALPALELVEGEVPEEDDVELAEGALVVPVALLVSLEVVPVPLGTGTTTEDSPLAEAVDDVDVW